MFHALSIGASALRANQIALDVTGHNIANANTEGYSRQRVHFAERGPTRRYGFLLGSGVDVSRIERAEAGAIGRAIGDNLADVRSAETQLRTVNRIEALLAPGIGSLNNRLQGFFDSLERLSARPGDYVARLQAVNDASRLTSELNSLAASLGELGLGVEQELQGSVDRVNEVAQQIVGLNRQILQAKHNAASPNTLLDRRGQLADELASLVGARVDVTHDTVEVGGGLTLGTVDPPKLGLEFTASGAVLTAGGASLPVYSGVVGGLLTTYNETLPTYTGMLDELAGSLIGALDPIHATGLGVDGPLQQLASSRPVNDVAAPLATAAALPVEAGELFVGITDLATGHRSLHSIAVDPAADTLEDVATRLAATPNLNAIVDSQTGRLVLQAPPGYGFDFTGRPPSEVDASGLSGTSLPSAGGLFDGNENTTLHFEFTGAGEVGLTAGLQLQVTDAAGSIVSLHDIGASYSPGDTITLSNGLEFSLSAGTVAAGESFSVPAIADADSSGLLAAIGFNTFFSGSQAADIAVRTELADDVAGLATSRSGASGEGENLLRMLDARDERVAAGGRRTIEQFAADLVGVAGEHVAGLTSTVDHLGEIGQQLSDQRSQLVGVDPNEELVKMVQYQRSFQASARFMAAVNETLDELFRIL